VDQYTNNSLNEPLWALLANPANDAHLYANNLEVLVSEFPQSGILQALLAHASDEKNLRHASVYFNAKSLYKLINSPSAFTEVQEEKIIIQTGIRANGNYQNEKRQEAVEVLNTATDENMDHNINDTAVEDNAVIETGPQIAADQVDHQPAMEHEVNLSSNIPVTDTHNLPEATSGMEENAVVEGLIENKSADAPEAAHTDELPEQEAEKGISDEIFDEIVGIEHISIEPEANRSVAAVPDEEIRVPDEKDEPLAIIDKEDLDVPDEKDEPLTIIDKEDFNVRDEKDEPLAIIDEEDVNVQDEKAEPLAIINNEEERLITDNIASSDLFDRTFGETKPAEQPDNTPVEQVEDKLESLELSAPTTETTQINSAVTDDTNHKDVSKYHDEQMPYTFMWWLDKTRKEHAGTYQPYVKSETVNSNDKPKRATDELQQQYFENIFHITSVDELDKSTAPPIVPFDIKRKEHKIIERFIKEEPQIKPQSSDKLDNENKAKKSSEDRDELVTETLAAIYTDQMLYHKAIASYKKLILKFPEKSRYFAGKIEQLEKKTS